MRAIFHAGHAKTGSTALQATCLASREALIRRGVLYPRNPNGRYLNHKLLFADLFEPELVPRHIAKNYAHHELPAARDELLASIRAEIAEHAPDCLLLSSESRFGNRWSPDQRRRFVEALASIGAREAEIVVYVRRPSGFFLSGTQQRLRASHEVKKPHFLQTARPIAQFVEDFGRGRVHLRPFDRSALDGGDVVEDFVGRLLSPHGVAPSDLTAGRNDNASLSAEATDVSRRHRLAFHLHENDRFTEGSTTLLAALAAVDAALGLPRPRMPDALAERIDYARGDLLKLRDRHGLVLPGYDYARLERGERTALPQAHLPLHEIMVIDREAQARLIARLREGDWAEAAPGRARWLEGLAREIEAEAARPALAEAPSSSA